MQAFHASVSRNFITQFGAAVSPCPPETTVCLGISYLLEEGAPADFIHFFLLLALVFSAFSGRLSHHCFCPTARHYHFRRVSGPVSLSPSTWPTFNVNRKFFSSFLSSYFLPSYKSFFFCHFRALFCAHCSFIPSLVSSFTPTFFL